MKKFFLFLVLLIPFIVNAQNDVIGSRGIFRNGVFIRDRWIDTLLNDTSGWLNKVRSYPTAHAIAEFLQGRLNNVITIGCQSKLLTPYSVIWAGTDYDFSVSAGDYQIDCDLHSNGTTLIELPVADATQDRIDVIYLGTDNAVHFVSGDLAPPGFAVEPILASDQFKLVAIPVGAATTTPTLTEEIIYDENTESTASGTGVTVNSAATTPAPYQGTVSTLIDATTNGDLIIWIKVSGTWSTLGKDALQFFMKLGSIMAQTTTYRMTLWNSSTQVSPTEVPVAINRNDITNWQPVSISIPAFGNLLNTNFDRVRIRITATTTHTGPVQIDYMRLVDGAVTPPGTGNITASEGLTKIADDIRWMGDLSSPAQLTSERSINLRRKILHFNNSENQTITGGPLWQHSDKPFSPFQFISTDTLSETGLPASPDITMPLSGIFARRNMFYASGAYRINKSYGHYLGQTYNFLDSMSFDTQGGDYNQAVTIENRYKPRGTGRQVMRAAHGTGNDGRIYWAIPTLLVNTYFNNSVGNHIYARGHYSGVNSYLIFGGNSIVDTIERFVYYTTGAFTGSASKILKSYDFAPAAYTASSVVDSSYGIYDTTARKFHTFRGHMVVGAGDATATSDVMKIFGNANVTDSLILGKAHEVADSTGVDVLLRRRTDGSIFRIRADLLGVGGGGGITLAAVGSSPNANAATLTGSVLNLEPAAEFNPGVVTADGSPIQTFGGQKSFSGVVQLQNQTRFESNLRIIEQAASSTPPSGFGYMYPKTDGKLYWKDDAGTEYDLTDNGGGGGGVTTVDPFNTTPNADGLTITGTGIALNRASGTQPGGIIVGAGLAMTGAGVLSAEARTRLNTGGTTYQAQRINIIGTGITMGTGSGDIDIDFSGLTGGGGATAALDNLASVAINTSLISDADNVDDLGSASIAWKNIYGKNFLADGSTSGGVEYKSDALGNAPNITTLSGTGYSNATMLSRIVGSDFTMVNSNTVQPVFPTSQDVWTLQGSTTYYFEGLYSFGHASASHSIGMSFELGGGASVTSIAYHTLIHTGTINAQAPGQSTTFINQTTNTTLNAAGANATEHIRFSGFISMNAGGTVTPSITFSADPTGTCLAKVGTYITFTPVGTNTISTLGNVN